MDSFQFLLNPSQELWNEMAVKIYNDVGWKTSFDDYDSFLEGFGKENFAFIVAVDKASGEPVACICGARFPCVEGSPSVFPIGQYYVLPEYRAHGLGKEVFAKLVEFADGANMFLYAEPKMKQKYIERSGFDKFAEWDVIVISANTKSVDLTRLQVEEDIKIASFNALDFNKVMEYDRETLSTGFAVDVEGNVFGYCHARIVYKNAISIGPFYADTQEVASTLLKHTLEAVPGFYNYESLNAFISTTNTKGLDIYKSMRL
ncbi:hypothetical protein QR680_008185 [Steinernema hermaphroditum]|uniref:N-acetyltransferase domain-containing protein n=1 Tax=Steinernema hermaphroditum TaxID=289476 RepID=A0AA39IHX3_9BILA|nr:hypothetical protein QR680_008185 [Steinernema hermaphroditum]